MCPGDYDGGEILWELGYCSFECHKTDKMIAEVDRHDRHSYEEAKNSFAVNEIIKRK
jgi:hypothetical protein